jgi:hypothetical protein
VVQKEVLQKKSIINNLEDKLATENASGKLSPVDVLN